MENPFRRRVTERLRDDEAFLALVSPEPVSTFLGRFGKTGELYELLVIINGAPGSGKTTLARLFQYRTIATLLRNRNLDSHKSLLATLTESGAITTGDFPRIVGTRLPMESNYRDLWEFPYPEELRTNLLTTFIQARAVLGWLRELRVAGIGLEKIEAVPREDAGVATETIGGTTGEGLHTRARDVELAIYGIASALLAPTIESLPRDALGAYRPFDVIDRIRIKEKGNRPELVLQPVIILDDAHSLHPTQFQALQRWLIRRELRVGRWVLTRLDILSPGQVLTAANEHHDSALEMPGITKARDTLDIWLQSTVDERKEQRTSFRRMAKDMAGRYLRQMSLFSTRGINRLEDMLANDEPALPPGKLRDLSDQVATAQRKFAITKERRSEFEKEIARYEKSSAAIPADLRLEVLLILMHRYVNRVPQASLFSSEQDPEPSKPLTVKKAVVDGARIHLLHRFNRPYYFGIDNLCDASSENAEQFLRLASLLVDHAATQLTRGKAATLDPAVQDKELRKHAAELIHSWNFPHHERVRRLTDTIAKECVEKSCELNAPLGAGANAFGIRAADFEQRMEGDTDLSRVLQFAIAYNAITLVPNYTCKDEKWYLLELGGLAILKHGLPLQRGGFLERTADYLSRIVTAPASATITQATQGQTKDHTSNV